MHCIIAPAKRFDMMQRDTDPTMGKPMLIEHSALLLNILKKYDALGIEKLMRISPKLADLNARRYKRMQLSDVMINRAAILAFQGDVYQSMDPSRWSKETMQYAQDHVRILSGFYGLLRPLDGIAAHRLEMSTPLPNTRGKNLYAFWHKTLDDAIDQWTQESVLINLASAEYAKAIGKIKSTIININFLQCCQGKRKNIGILSKRARGLMTHFICSERIDTPDGIKDFNAQGYRFDLKHSDAENWYFTRDA